MRTILLDSEANDILSPFYKTLTGSVEKGIKDFNTYLNFSSSQLLIRHVNVPAAKSMIIWNYIINHVKNDFDGVENIQSIVYKRVFGLLIYDRIFLRFKKIDKKGNSENVDTRNAELFNSQGELKNFPEKPVLLKLGWIMNPTNTDIKDLFIVCPRNPSRIHWRINIYDQSSIPAYLFGPTDPEPSPEIDSLLEINAKLKQTKTHGNT
jgi:hypothetical protein